MTEHNTLSISLTHALRTERAIDAATRAVADAASVRRWRVVGDGNASAAYRIDVCLADDATSDIRPPGMMATEEEQSYRIRTHCEDGTATVSIVADGVLGAAYGLFWVADRIRTQGDAPEAWLPQDAYRRPRFAQRIGIANVQYVRSDKPPYIDMERSGQALRETVRQLDHALAAGASAVATQGTQYLVPWGDDRYGPRSEACREIFRAFLSEAHRRRLAVYTMGDEFLYLPEWFERMGATLSTDDPMFYEALKSKYRGVLRELPELDGVATRIGEIIPQGDIMSWHVIHTGDDRSIEGNYRRFIQAIHEVVVGEFGKQYLHRTWTVNTWEQSSVPEIYARTFTHEVPTDNLILSIKITTGDQWEWTPINPTFGQTPHRTAAQVETARAQDYLSGSPDFAVEFAQAGLEWALEHGAAATLINQRAPWEENLWGGMEYTAWRFAWDPYQPARRVVREWASAMVGSRIADRVAELLLDLDDIHREGFHVHGPAYHTWEPFRHARMGWICKGNPYLDGGRGQHRHLRKIYLMAKPELESGLRTMTEHTARYDRWLDQYREWMQELPNPERGLWLETILARGQDRLHINLAYVRGFLRYFDYVDNPDTEHHERARAAVEALEPELVRFRERYAETVQGIEEFLKFARPGIEDVDAAERAMSEAPDAAAVDRMLAEARERDEAAIEDHPDAPQVVRWVGVIDARVILHVAMDDGTCRIERVLGDGPTQNEVRISPCPSGAGRCVVELAHARERGWAYILEQPAAMNNNTLKILLDDRRPGQWTYDVRVHWIKE